MTHRCLVQLEETDQYLTHYPPTNGTKAIAATSDVSFAQEVVP